DTYYREDSFIQHLVRDHKMPEPLVRRKARGWRSIGMGTSVPETCILCGNIYASLKKLLDHIVKHLEQLAIPILALVYPQPNERSPYTATTRVFKPTSSDDYLVRMAPKGLLYVCPSPSCEKAYKLLGDYENHIRERHQELPPHDPHQS